MRRRGVVLVAGLAFVLGAGTVPARAYTTWVPYVVVLRDGSDPDVVSSRHARDYGVRVTMRYRYAVQGYAARVPSGKVDQLRADSDVLFLTKDRSGVIESQRLPTGVDRINAESKANTGTGVNVAVIDTGIDVGHPDLAANIAGGTSCLTSTTSFEDGNGHGTHVAGTIAALDNGMGVVGVAPGAKLWAVRALNSSGVGRLSNILCGVDFVDARSPARTGPITVVNMSLSGPGSDDGDCGLTNHDALHKGICKAVADGVTFAVAAGNDGHDFADNIPAAYGEVIAVTAFHDTDGAPCGTDDRFASFSSFAGSASELAHTVAGPGVHILSTWPGGGTAVLSGTSMATPHVAGAAALYIAAHPGASPAEVLAGLKAPGEPKDVSFHGECPSGAVSHTDRSGVHPEVLVRADSL